MKCAEACWIICKRSNKH